MKKGRRTFLKTLVAGGIAAQGTTAVVDQQKAPARQPAARKTALEYPRKFSGRQLAMLAFPLGGIGAGSISLGGRGQLRDWEIFNRAEKGKSPQYAFPSIWVQGGDLSRPGQAGKPVTTGRPIARVLEAEIAPPYEGSSGLGSNNVPGLPRLQSCVFTGEFPMAKIAFQDPRLPVNVTLDAFTPFIPLDADDSGLPVAVLRYTVSNPTAAKVRVSIAWSVDNPVGTQGRANEYRKTAALEGLLMRNPFLPAADPLAGSFALSVAGVDSGKVTYLRGWRGAMRWKVAPLLFWDDFSSDGELGPEPAIRDSVGSLCLQREIAPGATAAYTFLLSWHFPNRTPERCGWRAPKGEERAVIGNYYCTRFKDAWEAAEYAAGKLPELEKRTRQFVSAVRETTLPAAVREAAMANLSTLVTPTCFRTADGDFHGFEGSNNVGGCCMGNCTHVWNYEAATAHLFPTLSRSLREAAFGFCCDEEGRMDFRQLLPKDKEHFGIAAADGQMGAIMKLYLDWRLSGDTEWLRRHWPTARRALEFAWAPGGWDADRDGVMEGCQHNTYDVEFFGPNPLCGVWYLGALRAGEEMARALGDTGAAAEYRRLFESGSKWIDRNLFNGEYYIQKVQGIPKEKIAKGLISGMGAADPANPDFQLGEGCLVDQLVGQYFADVAGLGLLLSADNVRKTLESIYKYNYKRSLHEHESVQRVYALNDEAALVICDYARGRRPEVPFPYFAEIMTGFEYSAAVLMLYRGMVAEGLELIENIRRRYDGERRNPWNEAECGHHYARAMASWSAIPALSGFRYHAAERSLSVAPLIHAEKFSSLWSTATGWGTFSHQVGQRQARVSVSPAAGGLRLRTAELAQPARAAASSAKLNDSVLPHRLQHKGRQSIFAFTDDVALRPGDQLLLSL